MKLKGVHGDLQLHRKTGETVAAKDGTLEVMPDDRIEGKGDVNVDGQCVVSLDGGALRAREELGQPVLTFDKGSVLIDAGRSTTVVVETPQGTIRPEGRIHLDVGLQEVGLVVLEGHALVTTREKPKGVDVNAGERASLRGGQASKRSASKADLDKGRALARRPIVTWCAGAPLPDWKISAGAIHACKDGPCRTGKILASLTVMTTWAAISLDPEPKLAAGGSTRVPLRGSFRFTIRVERACGGAVNLNFGGAAHTITRFLCRGGDWETVRIPVSPGARRHDGAAGWGPVTHLGVGADLPFEICDFAFDADSDSGRSDNLHEETLVSFRNDRAAPKGATESIVGKTVALFDLAEAHVALPRALGPATNGAFVLEAFKAELRAREPLPIKRAGEGSISLRFSAHATAPDTQARIGLSTSNGRIDFPDETVGQDGWTFFEGFADKDVPRLVPLESRLEKVRLELAGDRTPAQRDGLQLDDIEVFFWAP